MTSSNLVVNGIRLHADSVGPPDAPTIVLLHALATDISLWEAQVDVLADSFRVVRLDMRGHGASSSTPPPYDLDLLVSDVIGAMDALVIDRAHIVGLSIGGMLALGLALDYPERVDHVVVADARADAPDEYIAIWDGAISTVETSGFEPVIETSLQRWFTADYIKREPEVVNRLRQTALATSQDGFIGCARSVQRVAYLPRLGEITAPMLFIAGELDAPANPTLMRGMADATPGAELKVIPGAAHFTAFEAPEAFTDLLLDFLPSGSSQEAL
jgi:3-oxoadipate enol-lactonase